MSDESTGRDLRMLSVRICELILLRDELTLRICHQLERDYQLIIGQLEYDAFLWRYRTMRLQSRLSLVQAALEADGCVFLPAIESRLDREYAPYEHQLGGREARLEYAKECERETHLSAVEEAELRRMYKEVVWKVHPEIHPVSPSEKKLFLRAVRFYCEGDLPAMRSLVMELNFLPERDLLCPALEPEEQLELLQKMEQQLDQEIDEIRSNIPYTFKEFLEDPFRVTEMQQQLRTETEKWQAAYREYEEEMEELLGGTE